MKRKVSMMLKRLTFGWQITASSLPLWWYPHLYKLPIDMVNESFTVGGWCVLLLLLVGTFQNGTPHILLTLWNFTESSQGLAPSSDSFNNSKLIWILKKECSNKFVFSFASSYLCRQLTASEPLQGLGFTGIRCKSGTVPAAVSPLVSVYCTIATDIIVGKAQ